MMISVGYENYVNSSFMVGIFKPDSSPQKKLRHRAENERMLINATSGRKARSLIVMKSNHIIFEVLILVKPNGVSDLPGGKVEYGENKVEALDREIIEETGLIVKIHDPNLTPAGWLHRD
jgi:regulator of extracellular matrix RemA (YlzA/DUF370 family)